MIDMYEDSSDDDSADDETGDTHRGGEDKTEGRTGSREMKLKTGTREMPRGVKLAFGALSGAVALLALRR